MMGNSAHGSRAKVEFFYVCCQLHAFFYKERSSRPGSKSSLFLKHYLSNFSTKSS